MPSAAVCPTCAVLLKPMTAWLGRCPSCGLYLSSLEAGPGTGVDGLELLRRQNFDRLLAGLETHRTLLGARVLEIGCAKGWFLTAAKDQGAIVTGVEPEAANTAIARAAGLTVEEGLFPDVPREKGPYDFVVFNDVFEHLPAPAEAIEAAAGLLKPEGMVVINLPSSSGTLYRIARLLFAIGIRGPFERLWQKGMPSPHITYFSPDNLRRLVETKTALREVGTVRLNTVTRTGLWDRVRSQPTGLPPWLSYIGVLALSFVLPVLPSDIHVGIFAAPAEART